MANNKMIYSQDEITHTQQLQQAMNDVLQMALAHQLAGEIEEAQQLYLEIIDIQPKHAEANHNLGVIEAGLKGVLAALPRFEIALQVKPEIEQYWMSYVKALMQSGHTDSVANVLELAAQDSFQAEALKIQEKNVKNLDLTINSSLDINC